VADKQKGILFAVSASFLFGLSPIFMRLVLDLVNVATMNVLFTVFASLCFAVAFGVFRKTAYFRSILANWRKMTLMSLFSAAGALLFTYGISLYGPVNAAFLIQFTAVFTILFGVAFFKERFTRLEGAGILVAVVGVFVLAYGNLSLEVVSTLVLLAASLFFASANTLSKAYVKKVNPVALAGGNAMFVLLFVFAFAVFSGTLETAFPSVTLMYAFLGAVTGAVLSFVLFFKALQVFEVSKTATIRTMEPFLTAIFSFVILALPTTANQLVGGVLIVIGVATLSLTKRKNESAQNATTNTKATQ
jgi:drug/metabolite transporter (DMT)-like permease